MEKIWNKGQTKKRIIQLLLIALTLFLVFFVDNQKYAILKMLFILILNIGYSYKVSNTKPSLSYKILFVCFILELCHLIIISLN